jgi:hypothetical protein
MNLWTEYSALVADKIMQQSYTLVCVSCVSCFYSTLDAIITKVLWISCSIAIKSSFVTFDLTFADDIAMKSLLLMSSTRLCNSSFESQYAFITSNMDTIHIVNDNSIHIDDYLRNMHLRQKIQTKDIFLICENGHLLDKYESSHRKCHFRHKRNCDLDMNPMTKWHATWQGHFLHQEVIHDKTEKSYKLRKADVLQGNHVLEFQHSPCLLYTSPSPRDH